MQSATNQFPRVLPAILVGLLMAARGIHAQTHPDIVITVPVTGANPGNGWHDSYSVGDRCYCESSFDHGIGVFQYETPLGWMTVAQACALLGPGPGSAGWPKYNDVQCGNGPPNDAGDEHTCPGRTDIGPSGCGQIGPKWNFNPAAPGPATPSPTKAPTLAPTQAPVGGPAPITSYFVDCGPGDEDLISGSFWTDTTGQSISNTGSYSHVDFQTARSGNGFTYTIPGFASGVTASITLGWAELWSGACASGKRQFDVTVNGVSFVTDFDVSGTAGGCYSAVFETQTFQANPDGTFVLDFTKGSIQNPLVNIINIQA